VILLGLEAVHSRHVVEAPLDGVAMKLVDSLTDRVNCPLGLIFRGNPVG
jgi:hypothetical protein